MTHQAIVIHRVETRSHMRDFLRLPKTLYRADPLHVPDDTTALRHLLDRSRSPFMEDIIPELYVAYRDGRAVGRLGVFHRFRSRPSCDRYTSYFGFFETENDRRIVASLLACSRESLARSGTQEMIGPVNLSMHLECGLLIEHDGRPPSILLTHNPSWYARMLEETGFEPETDLLVYRTRLPGGREGLERAAARAQGTARLRIRSLNPTRYREEMKTIGHLYNQAWARNEHFVPLTDAEGDYLARAFRPILDPRLVLIALWDETPIGFSMSLPDINPFLQATRGWPRFLAALPILWWSRRRRWAARLAALGVVPAHRHPGVAAALVKQTLCEAVLAGYKEMEFSWILEHNFNARGILEAMGASVTRRYRLYRLSRADN